MMKLRSDRIAPRFGPLCTQCHVVPGVRSANTGNCKRGSLPRKGHGRALLHGIKTPGLPGQITIISQDGGWRLLQRR
jgi:hypothetical protein